MKSRSLTVVPDGTSDEEDDSGTDDELDLVQRRLRSQVLESEESSSDETSSSEEESRAKRSQSKKKKRLHWEKKPFVPPASAFNASLPLPPAEIAEPIDYFYSMFGTDTFTLLKDQSNLYSVQSNPNRPANISDTEIRQFIGILIMSGVYSFPHQRLFWAGSTRVPSIASAMSRDRFLQIKKCLHVVDNTYQPHATDPDFDRAYKVRPLLTIVKDNFRKIPKEEHLSVDEQIIPFKGRSAMKQHMPKKPHRWGYKMFVLAGGQSGICYDFVFYTGKPTTGPQFGFCTDIALKLCETVPRMVNHKLYADNYYTTMRLQVELKKLGIFAVGTVRTNRLTDVSMREEKSLASEGRGSMDYRITRVDDVVLCATRWYDNNVVNCLSTLHGCESTDMVKRWSAKDKKHIQITRPNVIKMYNQFMGGVDLLDMLVSLYRINIRSKKYYIKIIFHLIDLSIVNSWLVYRRHCSQLRIPKHATLPLLQFRVEVAEALLKFIPPPQVNRRGRPPKALSSSKDTASGESARDSTCSTSIAGCAFRWLQPLADANSEGSLSQFWLRRYLDGFLLQMPRATLSQLQKQLLQNVSSKGCFIGLPTNID